MASFQYRTGEERSGSSPLNPFPSTDPALELVAGGRSLLQQRLALYGGLLTVLNTSFFVGFQQTWRGEPSVGPERALQSTFSPAALTLAATYAAIGLLPLLRGLSANTLRAIDLFAHIAVGACCIGISLTMPILSFGVYESLLALTGVLSFRALLVPSSALWTAFVGAMAVLPSFLAVFMRSAEFAAPLVAPETMRMIFVGRCLLALAFSTLASAVLYRLRRQVREARKLGQYTLEERLGEGGMGVVYRASHAMLRRPTAIKLLSPDKGGSLARFEREAQLTAQLTHPNAIVVHDYGRTSDGVFYYAMEYLDGIDLEQLVELDGPQPPGRVIHLLRQACGALAEAHAAGLIHRDIKPANLFVCRRRSDPDFLKVLDFGLVKDLAATEGGSAILATGAHTFVGTPLYMAPEAIACTGAVDARSDLYALGAVAYRLLTGTTVFDGASAVAVAAHHLYDVPTPPSERLSAPLPGDLEAVVLRCLAKNPADRFADADELANALERCTLHTPWSRECAQAWWIDRAQRIERLHELRRAQISSGRASVLVAPEGRSLVRTVTELAHNAQ